MPIRILVVDDHELVRRGLRALLPTESEWKVCGEAVNGREAVETPPTAVVVENRQPLANDGGICDAGALVYTVDSEQIASSPSRDGDVLRAGLVWLIAVGVWLSISWWLFRPRQR